MNRIISYTQCVLILPLRPSIKACNFTVTADGALHSIFILGLSINTDIFPFYFQYAYNVYVLNLIHVTGSLQVNLYLFY
jgi:hypothetical protein